MSLYYASLNKTQSLYREIKDYLNEHSIDSLRFSRDLSDASLIFRDILGANHANEEVARFLRDINDLNAIQVYPVLLSLFQVETNVDNIKLVLKALITAYVRHNVIGQLESSRLEDFSFKLAKELRSGVPLQDVLARIRQICPDDEAFMRDFEAARVSRVSTIRYLLREYERLKRETEEMEVSTPTRVHVEHIYPQTPQAGHAMQNHSHMVNRLGNLTLLSRTLNTSIKNAPFNRKKPVYSQSEIFIAKELGEHPDEWDEMAIEARQIEMAAAAPVIWELP